MNKRATILVGMFLLIAMMPGPLSAHTSDEPFNTEMIAGGGNEKSEMKVGHIQVWNDCENLYVWYVTDGDWFILETHLHIAIILDEIPQTKKGNPKPGHFDYYSTHLLGDEVTEKLYEIPLPDEWKGCVELLIAAHAVVENDDGKRETAWGDGDEFPGKNWAMYFKYIIQFPQKFWNLPEGLVGVNTDVITEAWFKVTLSGVPEGYDIYNGDWLGWCVDKDLQILNVYNYYAYSSYDPDLPSWANDDEQWDYINYILNHKAVGASRYDIQWAIWYFSDPDIVIPEFFHLAIDMVNDALENGAGFRPECGQVGAVILLLDPVIDMGKQVLFIEVDP